MCCLQGFNLGVVCFLQMFQGDLTADYTHTGYKQTVKHQRVLRAADYITSPADIDWCQSAAKSLLQVCGHHAIINYICVLSPPTCMEHFYKIVTSVFIFIDVSSSWV